MACEITELLVLCFGSMLLISDGSQQCASFGNNLTRANPSTARRLFANVSGPLTCAGNATSWNVCYYQSTTDYKDTQTYLGVYRSAGVNSTQYNIVEGSYYLVTVDGTQVPTGAYVCTNFSVSMRYTVYPGDILVACVRDPGGGILGVAATVPGAVVRRYNVFGGCSSLPTSPIDLSPTSATYAVLNDITLHIRLNINECDVNNGGCQQVCNDSTAGSTCSCYNGYDLAANGLNCTTILPSTMKPSPSSSTTTRSTADISVASSSIPTPSKAFVSTSSVAPVSTVASSPSQFIPIATAVQGQSSLTEIVVGVIVSIIFVIGVLLIIVAAILFRQRCVKKWNRNPQNGFGIHNKGYIDSDLEMKGLQPNPFYEGVKNEGSDEKLTYQVPRKSDPVCSDKKSPEPDNVSHNYSCPRCETHSYSHLHGDKQNSSCVPEFDKEGLSYSHLHQGPDDKKQSYSYCDMSINVKTSDHCNNDTQAADSNTADENLYYIPASQEVELYIQLENQKILKVQRHVIEINDTMLGSGHFGGVQVAVWNGPKGRYEVAIKTLNPSLTQPEEKIKFLQEAAIMAQFKHPNVIQLYGIVTDGEPVMLVMELASNKDLLTHLATMKPNSFDSSIKSDLPKVLLDYSKQIALGMLYLSSKLFVHRDLAARNVLVTKDCICKIADFGMSRDLAEGNYYMSHGGLVPVKWTAPEAVCFMKYSTASDVWSYGCLLYEIWSVGDKPFKGLTNEEAFQKVNTGYRLPPPPGCPLLLYQLMIKCWNPDAHLRPTFKDMHTCLSLHDDLVLAIPNEALLTHPQSGYLGAPLEAGKNMYLDLQKSYN